jgi:hypothetical protein
MPKAFHWLAGLLLGACHTPEAPERSLTYSWRLALLEQRRWLAGNSYERNTYLKDYPFGPVATAYVSDSVVYVRAYPLLPDRPRPDILYAYFQHGERRTRIPAIADHAAGASAPELSRAQSFCRLNVLASASRFVAGEERG